MLASESKHLVRRPGTAFEVAGERYEVPKFLFIGPDGGGDPIRIAIFATIHGDEAVGTHALIQFLRLLEASPELARGYHLHIYPICNPTGYEDNTRTSRSGRDLNREFWNHSTEPEVQWLESELRTHSFHGLVSLHADDTSDGVYGFVRGATLTKHLLEPALVAAGEWLPRNEREMIDGFPARRGIIWSCYQGILGAPRSQRPRPFEIILEAPHVAPQYLQEQALLAALNTILGEYRKFIAYAADL
jgi:protein MpaA